jgi:hypothetical protein
MKWLTHYHPFLNLPQALSITPQLSYNLKHVKKDATSALQLESQSGGTTNRSLIELLAFITIS